jgi:rod shape-determining protein MreD
VTVSLSEPLRLWVRLLALALVAVIIQEAAVSQITVFGTSAEITVLVVMSVGLLAGSIPGAIMGFGTGLLVDIVLFQTLGVTSLLYITVGYWSGRLRELRDPSHGLVPMGMGAAATAFAGLGMALVQFLLGVDAPVSLLLLQQILIAVLVNTLISLPVYAVVRWVLHSAIPEDPRRRRRRHRAYTTGGLSPLQETAGRGRSLPGERLTGGRRARRTPRTLTR